MEENAVLSSAHLMVEYTIPCCESIDFSSSFSASRALYLMTSALYFSWKLSICYFVAIKPHSNAIPKLRNVPARTYSVFAVSVSLNRSMDFAAIIKPIASYCPMITNMIVRIRSKFPINAPAFLIFSQDCVSPTWYFFKTNLIRMFAGLMHNSKANMNRGIE